MEKEQQIERIKACMNNLEDKSFKILYYVPDMKNQPSGGIGVIYNHVKSLNELGYNAFILTDKNDYIKPEWLGAEYKALPHVSVEGNALAVSFEDILVIPEGYSPVMKDTENLPCRRVVFAQSWAYILNALTPGFSWANFGITDVITVQSALVDYIKGVFGNDRFNIKTVQPSISPIFKPSSKPRKPFIAVSAREQFNLAHVIKQFYLAYPQYRWIAFKDMRNMPRENFAETLGEACLSVWIDNISGFGTFPIESAKCGTPFIGLIPDLTAEYINEENGIWTDSMFDLPAMIANYIDLWLKDNLSDEIKNSIDNLKTMYTEENEKEQLDLTFSEYVKERKEIVQKSLEKLEGEVENEK